MTFRTTTLVLLGLASVDNAYAQPPRPLTGGETIALETADLRIPDEPRWRDDSPLPPLEPPAAPPPSAAAPALDVQFTLSDTLGIAATRIQGKDLLGEAALLNLGVSAKLPRTWLGLGAGVDVGFGAVKPSVENDEPGAWLMEANAYLIFRRLRLGVGWGRDAVEAGSKDGAPIDGVAVSGPRAFATLDLLSGSGLDLYVGVHATDRKSDYARTTFVLGLRAEFPKVLDLPADPWRKPETGARDVTPSPPAG